MEGMGLAYLGAGLGMGMAAIGTAIGIGLLSAKAMEGISRQPSATNEIRTTGIILTAFMEAIALYTLVVSILLIFK